jgi:hypothetical protein
MATNETKRSVIGPPTLDFELKTSTSKIAATASSVIIFTRLLSLKQSEDNREDEIGSEAEKGPYDILRGAPLNFRIEPGAHLQRSLFEPVLNESLANPNIISPINLAICSHCWISRHNLARGSTAAGLTIRVGKSRNTAHNSCLTSIFNNFTIVAIPPVEQRRGMSTRERAQKRAPYPDDLQCCDGEILNGGANGDRPRVPLWQRAYFTLGE